MPLRMGDYLDHHFPLRRDPVSTLSQRGNEAVTMGHIFFDMKSCCGRFPTRATAFFGAYGAVRELAIAPCRALIAINCNGNNYTEKPVKRQ